MGNSPVDRTTEYMKAMWGTTSLMTDYWSLPHKTEDPEEVELNEVMHHKANALKLFLKKKFSLQRSIKTSRPILITNKY